MGTTLTAINADSGVALRTVVAIEGIPYLLTESSDDATSVLQAWADTEWGSADVLGGLSVQYNLNQSLSPWHPFEASSSRVTLTVMDDSGSVGDDVLGKLLFKREPTTSTTLAEDVEPDETAITVKRSDDFAATGRLFIGSETIDYLTNTVGTETFSTLTRGAFSPFEIEGGGGFGRTHYNTPVLPGVDMEATTSTIVATEPVEFKGRWCGVWLHRVVDGVLDLKAEAHCVFAGKVSEIEDGEDGKIRIHCVGVLDVIKETVILRQQWRARLREGMWVKAGTRFRASDFRDGTGEQADDLVVKPAGATPPYEFDEGFYSGDALASKINDWLAQARTDGDLNFKLVFHYQRTNTAGNIRSALDMNDPVGAAGLVRKWKIGCSSDGVRQFFGWNLEGEAEGGLFGDTALTTATAFSQHEPLRVFPWGDNAPGESTVYIDEVQGSFVDQTDLLPQAVVGYVGIIRVGNAYVPCEAPSVTNGSGTIVIGRPVNALLGEEDVSQIQLGVSQAGVVEITQVLVLEGSFGSLVMTMLASTGGANFPAYELLPEHCSAAIPFDLLTDDLETEIANAPWSGDVMRVIVSEPTKLSKIWGVSFILRHIQFAWRQGRIALKGFATPTSAATMTIGTDDRAAPVGTQDTQRAVTRQTEQWMHNLIRIRTGADAEGKNFKGSPIVIELPGSVANHGARPLTLEARNAVRGIGTVGEDVRALLPTFIAPLAFLGYPATIIRVPVHLNLLEQATPGEVCLFSDDFARDPSTGERGISGKPALIVEQSVMGWGGESGAPIGEVTLMIFPRLSLAPYCPTAQVASYDAGTKVLTCEAHEHSEASAAADATLFPIGSKVRVVQIDPDDAASPLTWDDVVAGQSGNTITLTTGLAGFDAALKYRVFSDDYADATTAQQAKVYQADDADGEIADLRAPYALAYSATGQATTFTASTGTELAARPPNLSAGDGRPLDTGHARDIAWGINALINYLTAPQYPEIVTERTHGGTGTWELVGASMVFIGVGSVSNIKTRKWYVGPTIKSNTGGSVDVRVTLATLAPSSVNPAVPSPVDVVRHGPYVETTFSTSSATYATATAVGLDISQLNLGEALLGGMGWLLVEIKNGAAYRGMGTMYLGPLEAP